MTDIKAIDQVIERVKAILNGSRIAQVFENCYSNTITKTLKKEEDGTCFVITGDIPVMWLRDSSCQMRPYVFLSAENEEIADMIRGVIQRQAGSILLDPYANAFNETADGLGHQSDRTEMKPYLWERKYEIDSLCYPLQLSWNYWKTSGKKDAFDANWLKMAETILRVFRIEQYHESRSDYYFERFDCPETDTLKREGRGNPVKDGIGLIWSGFRPSDDACVYGYFIPGNMLAVVELRHMAEILRTVYKAAETAAEAEALAAEVDKAIGKYGIIHGEDGDSYAYEVDGFGNVLAMDDANLPSLLSAPYFGYGSTDDPLYVNTRRRILSHDNPYYYEGSCLKGIGSPHTPPGNVWDISLAMEGLTNPLKEAKLKQLEIMIANDAGTGMMHESINCCDANDFTRPWFSWANAVFSELVLQYTGILPQ